MLLPHGLLPCQHKAPVHSFSKKWNPTVVKSGILKLRIMSQQIDRMGVQQAQSSAPSKPRKSVSLQRGPVSRLWDKSGTKWECGMEGDFDHWTKQLLSQERTLEQSAPGPGSRIRQQPQGLSPVQRQTPGFLSKPDCVVPIWSPNGCTSYIEKRHLVDFAHSCSYGCWFSDLSAIFSCHVSSIVVCAFKCVCYSPLAYRPLYT